MKLKVQQKFANHHGGMVLGDSPKKAMPQKCGRIVGAVAQPLLFFVRDPRVAQCCRVLAGRAPTPGQTGDRLSFAYLEPPLLLTSWPLPGAVSMLSLSHSE